MLVALVTGLVTVGIVPSAADVPPTPIAAPFDAPLCENTTGDPSVDVDGGPVVNLRSVFGQRLADYNNGQPVILYNNDGSSGWAAANRQYAANPICTVRYVDEVGGPVSSWAYCTDDYASTCAWTNAQGQLERQGVVRPGLTETGPDPELTADQQALQAYIIQNDVLVVAGPSGDGDTVVADTIANDDTPMQRRLRQNLVHCIDSPGRTSALVFCANNMSPATQARILEIVGSDPADQLNLTSPTGTFIPGATGEIELTTTLAGIPLGLRRRD